LTADRSQGDTLKNYFSNIFFNMKKTILFAFFTSHGWNPDEKLIRLRIEHIQ
jgi:hypothetical protein